MRPGRLEDQLPRFAAISCFKQTALAAVGPQMPHRRDIGDVRIFWIDNDARNGAAIFQPDICPMLAAVGCPINPVSPIGRIPIVRFAAPNPNDIRIGRRNCDSAD